jgi:hypothetical protein
MRVLMYVLSQPIAHGLVDALPATGQVNKQMTQLYAVTQSKLIYTPQNNSKTGVFSGK